MNPRSDAPKSGRVSGQARARWVLRRKRLVCSRASGRACHHGVVQTFKVKLWERLESPPQEPHRGTEDPGFRAPGRIVLVFREGSGWVTGQDGSREAVEARTVVIYETGDWIEYGDDGSGDAFEAELYGASALSGDGMPGA
jgi:hypothetical protein